MTRPKLAASSVVAAALPVVALCAHRRFRLARVASHSGEAALFLGLLLGLLLTASGPAYAALSFVNPSASPTVFNGPIAVTSGDFNGDGKLDLATVSQRTLHLMTILRGNGKGTFFKTPNQYGNYEYTLGQNINARSIISGDFNGDGKLDLVTANSGTNNVFITQGIGNGNFGTFSEYPVGTTPHSVISG